MVPNEHASQGVESERLVGRRSVGAWLAACKKCRRAWLVGNEIRFRFSSTRLARAEFFIFSFFKKNHKYVLIDMILKFGLLVRRYLTLLGVIVAGAEVGATLTP